MRDPEEMRRIHPKHEHPPTVGIPDENVFPLPTRSAVLDAVTDGRPVLARADDGSLFTITSDEA